MSSYANNQGRKDAGDDKPATNLWNALSRVREDYNAAYAHEMERKQK